MIVALIFSASVVTLYSVCRYLFQQNEVFIDFRMTLVHSLWEILYLISLLTLIYIAQSVTCEVNICCSSVVCVFVCE